MIKVTITHTRPNTNIPFGPNYPVVPAPVTDHIHQNYILPGKLVNFDRAISADGLVLTLTRIWADQAALDEFTSDQFVNENSTNPLNAYLEQNNIVVERVEETI